MSVRSFRILSVAIILFVVFSVEFIAQKSWILWVQSDGYTQIQKCLMLPEAEQNLCLVTYIENRNERASIGINGYLVTIVLVGGYVLVRTVNNLFRKRKK